jgi:molybdenum cofactor cytidylyltransferase
MKIPAVILAAGASRRLGEPKQLVELDGETMLYRVARMALLACDPVMVVLGYEAERMKTALKDLSVRCVRNLEWEEGMASSLRTAVSALPLDARSALFLVSDQPALDSTLIGTILEMHRTHPSRRIASVYRGIRGVPAVLLRQDFDALLQLHGDQGARSLLQGPDVSAVPFPGGELDLDRPEDLLKLKGV